MRTNIRRREGKTGVSYQANIEFYIDGTRKRKSKTFNKKKNAETYLKEQIKIYDNHTDMINKNEILFIDLTDEVNKVHVNKIKASTHKRYKSFAKKINTYFSKSRLKDITPKKLDIFYSNIINTKSTRSNSNPYSEVEKIHKYLTLIFNYALKWGYVTNNVMKTVTPPKKCRKEIECWSDKEIEIFLYNIQADETYYNPFFFALNTGCRVGEVCGLRWIDVDFNNDIIKIRKQLNQEKDLIEPKSKSSIRDIPMFPSLKTLLEKLYTNLTPENDSFVFLTNDGEPFNPTSLSKSFVRRIEKIEDIKKITFHGLRHTFVTVCATKYNIPLTHISKIIGHAKVSITSDIYFHLENDTALDIFKNIKSIA